MDGLNADLYFHSRLVFAQIPVVRANSVLERSNILKTLLRVSQQLFSLPHLKKEEKKETVLFS